MKYIITLFAVLIALFSDAQPKVLLVDDSDDTFGNTDKLGQAIQNAGYSISVFNAEANGANPELDSLLAADIVIWHTSTDGTSLQFWNGNDTDNEYVKAYLDQGGILWVIGNDFLYDRYNVAPATFSVGDFMYDYLGISAYALQSYGDDNSVGLKEVYAAPNTTITGLPTVNFTFSELWWADGFGLAPAAEKVFVMGDSNYVFLDTATAVLYSNPNGGTALTFGFDLALASSDSLIAEVIAPTMNYLESLVQPAVSVQSVEFNNPLKVYPNPAHEVITFSTSESGTVEIYNALGMQVTPEKRFGEGTSVLLIQELGLKPGFYFLNFKSDSNALSLVKLKVN